MSERIEIDDALLDHVERALFRALEDQGPEVPCVGNFRGATQGGTLLDGDFDLRAAARAVVDAYLRWSWLNG